jgi:hypothetical protein
VLSSLFQIRCSKKTPPVGDLDSTAEAVEETGTGGVAVKLIA